jgi:hypothetical protein
MQQYSKTMDTNFYLADLHCIIKYYHSTNPTSVRIFLHQYGFFSQPILYIQCYFTFEIMTIGNPPENTMKNDKI